MDITNFSKSFFSKVDLIEILQEIDEAFVPSLKSRIVTKAKLPSFDKYLDKILNRGDILVAHEGNDIAGFIMFYANDFENFISYISLVVVKNNYQGQGVGKKIVSQALQTIKEKGMKKVRIKTWKTNKNAIFLYKKSGFFEIQSDKNDIVLEIKL